MSSTQKKIKKKGQDDPARDVAAEKKIAAVELAVGKYMKTHLPTKRTKFLHHQVNYFYANKAVDVLLDSQWATGKDVIFTDRQSVVDYCNKMLTNKYFHRAKKIAITDKDLKPKELKKKREREERDRRRRREIANRDGDSEDNRREDSERDEAKKKKKKIKLDMHLEQVFVDGPDAYVWMFDPVPFWYYIAGGALLAAAVAICLFPLWPPSVRKGVYYLSVAAAGFLGVILGLALLRGVLFLVIWVLSMGRHHLWILPNLTEDVGFLESFWPLFHYEHRGDDYVGKKKKKKRVTLKEDAAPKEEKPLDALCNEGSKQDAADEDCGHGSANDEEGQESAYDEERVDNGSADDTDRQTDGERREEYSSQAPSDSDEVSHHSQPFEMVDREDYTDEDHESDQ